MVVLFYILFLVCFKLIDNLFIAKEYTVENVARVALATAEWTKAKFENPSKKILVSGIGIKSIGDSFYGTIGTTKRSHVDKKIFFDLDDSIKDNLSTTDQKMSEFCSIPLIKDTL